MTDTDIYERVREAAGIIRGGGVAAFPTETVYGLGAGAFDEKAVARVFEIKRRPYFDPLILHVGGREWLDDLVVDIPEPAVILIGKLWPGPLTVVLPKKPAVPDIATSGLPGVALRMPSNDIARRLIDSVGAPIAAPSANRFGAVSPTTAEHVREQLGEAVDMVIDGGECTVGIESTIISFMSGKPVMLRPGGTPLEDIEEIIGKVIIPGHAELVNQSPGRSGQHYATSVPLVLVRDVCDINNIRIIGNNSGDLNSDSSVNNDSNISDNSRNSTNPACHIKKIGLLAFSRNDSRIDKRELSTSITQIEYLSGDGNLREAACNLFAAMRRLDASGVDAIAALPVPNTGLGLAINDRLFRASMKRTI
jgi:L-threonylcarbamoyladenylate synthase